MIGITPVILAEDFNARSNVYPGICAPSELYDPGILVEYTDLLTTSKDLTKSRYSADLWSMLALP